MTSQTKLTKDFIFKMVPQVTTKFNGRSKRALLLFVNLKDKNEIKKNGSYFMLAI
jgi:hypothetical protein